MHSSPSFLRSTAVFGFALLMSIGCAYAQDPAEELVIAFHSAREVASKDADWALEDALFEALTKALKH